MTAIEGKLCSTILREHFSEIVQKVANCLFRNGKQSLQFVRMSTKLPLDEVCFFFFFILECQQFE